jgi:hypothetical protein
LAQALWYGVYCLCLEKMQQLAAAKAVEMKPLLPDRLLPREIDAAARSCRAAVMTFLSAIQQRKIKTDTGGVRLEASFAKIQDLFLTVNNLTPMNGGRVFVTSLANFGHGRTYMLHGVYAKPDCKSSYLGG